MALEIRKVITDVHEQAVLCVAYNPHQRQIFTGSQDSTIKCWQSENGDLVRTLTNHAGWVTGLEFAADIRVLFSCSIDGYIFAWSAKGELLDQERAGGKETEAGRAQGGPLYCVSWDRRRQHLLAGANGYVWAFSANVGDNVDLYRDKILKLQGEPAHTSLLTRPTLQHDSHSADPLLKATCQTGGDCGRRRDSKQAPYTYTHLVYTYT